MRRLSAPVWVYLLLLLAACDDPGASGVTPTVTLSGASIAPSEVFYPNAPTQAPVENDDFGQTDPTAAALPADAVLPPLAVGTSALGSAQQHIQITAADGTLLDGDFYQSGDTRMPGVLLLAADRTAWGDFPSKIHDAGFTVLTVNIRQDAPETDVTVMLQSLMTGEADPARLAVIGADTGADEALIGCSGELLCDALVMLSPTNNEALIKAMPAFNPRSLFLAASQDDTASFGMIQSLKASATGDVFLQPFTSSGHGTEMLVNRPDLGDLIIQWLQQHV